MEHQANPALKPGALLTFRAALDGGLPRPRRYHFAKDWLIKAYNALGIALVAVISVALVVFSEAAGGSVVGRAVGPGACAVVAAIPLLAAGLVEVASFERGSHRSWAASDADCRSGLAGEGLGRGAGRI